MIGLDDEPLGNQPSSTDWDGIIVLDELGNYIQEMELTGPSGSYNDQTPLAGFISVTTNSVTDYKWIGTYPILNIVDNQLIVSGAVGLDGSIVGYEVPERVSGETVNYFAYFNFSTNLWEDVLYTNISNGNSIYSKKLLLAVDNERLFYSIGRDYSFHNSFFNDHEYTKFEDGDSIYSDVQNFAIITSMNKDRTYNWKKIVKYLEPHSVHYVEETDVVVVLGEYKEGLMVENFGFKGGDYPNVDLALLLFDADNGDLLWADRISTIAYDKVIHSVMDDCGNYYLLAQNHLFNSTSENLKSKFGRTVVCDGSDKHYLVKFPISSYDCTGDCENITGNSSNELTSSSYVFPNPADNVINLKVSLGQKIREIKVYDVSGNLIIKQHNDNFSVDVNLLSKGYYFLEVNYQNNEQKTFKFLKK